MHEFGGTSSIDDSMIAGERQRDHSTHFWFSFDGNYAIRNFADGENRSLWRNDDGRKCVDVIHTKIADRECRAADVIWTKAAITGAVGKIAPLNGDSS
jgi:hypothetical protein